MSIVLSRKDYPNQTIDQIQPTTDHRREVPPKNAAAAATDENDKLIARVADSVVAIVPSSYFEVASQPTPDKYWVVKHDKTVENYLQSRLQNHLTEAVKNLADLACPFDLDASDEAQIERDDKKDKIERNLLEIVNILAPKNCMIKEEFKAQLSIASATGCLISQDRILTCAHIDEVSFSGLGLAQRFMVNPKKSRLLFQYRNGEIRPGDVLPRWQVREIDRVEMIPWLAETFIPSLELPKWYDVAILKMEDLPLDAKPPAQTGIVIGMDQPKTSQPHSTSEKVFMVGCPSGMPLKYSSGIVLGDFVPEGSKTLSSSRYSTTLEQFRGNSGSPIFKQIDQDIVICGVASSGGRNSLSKLPRKVKSEAKAAITAILGKDPGLDEADYENLYHSREHHLLISDDGMSFTFSKIFDDDKEIKQNAIECRVDSVPILFSPFGKFAPAKSAQPQQVVSNYASMSIVLTYNSKITAPLTFGVINDRGASVKITTNSDKDGNTTVYIFADFGVSQDRSSLPTVTTALQGDLEDRALRNMLDNMGIKKFRDYIADSTPSRIDAANSDGSEESDESDEDFLLSNRKPNSLILSETSWTQGWKHYWQQTFAKRQLKITTGPVLLGGLFGDTNQPLAAYAGFKGAPGMLGLVQPDSLWVSQRPLSGKITLRYNRGVKSDDVETAKKFKFESFFFQGQLLFAKDKVPVPGEEQGTIGHLGRVERWMGPVVTADQMLNKL